MRGKTLFFFTVFAVCLCTKPYILRSRLEQIASDLDAFSKSILSPNLTVLVDQILMAFLTTCQKGSTFRIGRVQDLYNQMIPVLVKITTKQPDLYDQASNISKQLVALEVIPEAWKQTQFWHVANFPVEQWYLKQFC